MMAPRMLKPASSAAARTAASLPMRTGVRKVPDSRRAEASRMRGSVPSVNTILRGWAFRISISFLNIYIPPKLKSGAKIRGFLVTMVASPVSKCKGIPPTFPSFFFDLSRPRPPACPKARRQTPFGRSGPPPRQGCGAVPRSSPRIFPHFPLYAMYCFQVYYTKCIADI